MRLVLVNLIAVLASPTLAERLDLQLDVRRHVEFLAAPEREGRATGTPGARASADYLTAELEALGARPLPGQTSYLVPFVFTAGVRDTGSRIELLDAQGAVAANWAGAAAVHALAFSDDATVEGPVAFAGYGLVVPEERGGYDSYAGLDVRDKIVIALRFFPEDADPETRASLARYAGLRYKALHARMRGAKALVLVTGPRSGPEAPITTGSDATAGGSGIVVVSAARAVVDRLFAATSEATLESAQERLDSGNPHVAGFDLPGVRLRVSAAVERERRTARNVVGVLPRNDGDAAPEKPIVVVGAHYDHLGRGTAGRSLASDSDAVHPGADDNASGVSAVLRVAARLAGDRRRRDVVVAFWSGEELGLLGSAQFVSEKKLSAPDIAAYLNFDMVGRLRDNRLTIQGVGSSPAWERHIERANVASGFDIQVQRDPYLPTDSSSFHQARVPSVNFFTGSHEDYHRPSDRPDTLDYEGLARIADFGARIARAIVATDAPPEFQEVERQDTGGGRDTLRVYTGTIPDYASEVEGLRLSGVVKGGPAEAAGLRSGDVIVSFAGNEIRNIYDYTYALDAIRPDEPAVVIVLRDGERVELTIVPTTRR